VFESAPRPGAPAGAGAGASPLTEAQSVEVREAIGRRKAIKRAARTALGSSITTLGIGILSLPFVLFWPSASAIFVVAGILVVGAVEFVGHQRISRADPSAPRLLALNQLAFLGVITVYCIIQMIAASPEALKAEAISPEFRSQMSQMPGMLNDTDALIGQWGPLLMRGFYLLIIVLSIGFQGGLALYYHTRRKYVDAYNRQPEWVRRLLAETGA
jgi:hypothetical protein